MFGSKKRIQELEKQIESMRQWRIDDQAKIKAQANQIEYLVRTIRQTDDIIFSISQCTDWPQMRPRVAQLTDQMTSRKVAESNRINDLLRPQLIETYNDQTNVPKRIGPTK